LKAVKKEDGELSFTGKDIMQTGESGFLISKGGEKIGMMEHGGEVGIRRSNKIILPLLVGHVGVAADKKRNDGFINF